MREMDRGNMTMSSADRLVRVNELLKREIADYLERNPVAGAEGVLVSVTAVNCSADLHSAAVYVSIFGGGGSSGGQVMRNLEELRPDLQCRIARNLAFKYTPVLSFLRDDRIERGDRVLRILDAYEQRMDGGGVVDDAQA